MGNKESHHDDDDHHGHAEQELVAARMNNDYEKYGNALQRADRGKRRRSKRRQREEDDSSDEERIDEEIGSAHSMGMRSKQERRDDEGSEDDVMLEDEEDPSELRRKRQEEMRRRLAMMSGEERVRPQFVGSMAHSREKWRALWGMVKCLGYFLFMMGAFFIYSENYNKRTCVNGELNSGTGEEVCLLKNTTTVCTGMEGSLDSTSCQDECQAPPFSPVDRGEGCIILFTDPSSIKCLTRSEFLATCQDPFTCPDAAEDDLLSAVFYSGLLLAFSLVCEAQLTYGLMHFSSYHDDTFVENGHNASKKYSAFIGATKNMPTMNQVTWGLLFFGAFYLVLITFVTSNLCDQAVTQAGTKYMLPDQARWFVVGICSLWAVLGVAGSWVRFSWPLRGQLVLPPDEDAILVPFKSMDCHHISRRKAPRCCPASQFFWRDCCPSYMHFCCPVCAWWTIEIVTWPILACGNLNGWLWRNRHNIGP